jgi:hypothetical protein
MLDANKQVIWQHSNRTDIADQPVITTDGTVCIIAIDGIRYGLDVNTGNKKWSAPFMNGSANYKQIQVYKGDRYLVVVDMTGYRKKQMDPESEDAGEDILYLCKGGKMIWQKEFPRNSDLEVWGDKILAVTRKKGSTEIREIASDE